MSIKKTAWNFDNSYACLPEKMFSHLSPVPVRSPNVILFNHILAENLGLDFSNLSKTGVAALFSGNVLPVGAAPIAQAYAGHQYGHLTMLGDGRAIVLGEHITPDHQRVDIQLKGSGRTPYSRQGDGRAALSPMLREYVISEAMYALGIPTTRSLAVVATGEDVFRNTSQPGAILTRVASSHIRVGTFEYIATLENVEILKKMVNYTIDRHYLHLKEAENPALELLKAVIEKQIILITHWMRVGFIHGVMNTDNMTISGETIDYGPCAFMDAYDPKTVFSSIDRYGRYAFGNQPEIAQWNLTRFAETLLPLLHESQETAIQTVEDVLGNFPGTYQKHWLAMMRNKLGLFKQENEDEMLINDLLFWMQENKADYTNTFRALISKNFPTGKVFQDERFKLWHRRWQARLSQNACALESSFELMRANNPAVMPRNHKVEEALKAASEQGDLTLLNRLLELLSKPYEDFRSDDMSYQTPLDAGCVYKTFCGT